MKHKTRRKNIKIKFFNISARERDRIYSQKSTCDYKSIYFTNMNLGRIKDFNKYVYIACRRVLSPRESIKAIVRFPGN